ncbi:MAG: type II 3-dehydroquinate dehydratase [Anaerolineales bacterium]|jgi:3-dehydroquinate dehydratase-2
MKILILHGPNLNLLGEREPGIYGNVSLDEIDRRLKSLGAQHDVVVECHQSNHEGELIDLLHAARIDTDAILFNPGGYTHTSVALRDAVTAIKIPVIEVHLSNIYGREAFRQTSLLAPVCVGSISGFGMRSYELAFSAALMLTQA